MVNWCVRGAKSEEPPLGLNISDPHLPVLIWEVYQWRPGLTEILGVLKWRVFWNGCNMEGRVVLGPPGQTWAWGHTSYFAYTFLSFFVWLHCAACGILVPWPEIKPGPPVLEAQSTNHWTTRESKVKVLVAQLCLTLCNPMNCSLPGCSFHGTLQGRILKWVAIPFSRQILYRQSHPGSPCLLFFVGPVGLNHNNSIRIVWVVLLLHHC